jgi:hypothetical protein
MAAPAIETGPRIPLTGIQIVTITVTPASVLAATSAEQTFTCTGMVPTDVILSVQAAAAGTAGVVFTSARPGTDQVIIKYANVTAGPLTPGETSLTLAVYRNYQTSNATPVR